jgi:hypothetical protein
MVRDKAKRTVSFDSQLYSDSHIRPVVQFQYLQHLESTSERVQGVRVRVDTKSESLDSQLYSDLHMYPGKD